MVSRGWRIFIRKPAGANESRTIGWVFVRPAGDVAVRLGGEVEAGEQSPGEAVAVARRVGDQHVHLAVACNVQQPEVAGAELLKGPIPAEAGEPVPALVLRYGTAVVALETVELASVGDDRVLLVVLQPVLVVAGLLVAAPTDGDDAVPHGPLEVRLVLHLRVFLGADIVGTVVTAQAAGVMRVLRDFGVGDVRQIDAELLALGAVRPERDVLLMDELGHRSGRLRLLRHGRGLRTRVVAIPVREVEPGGNSNDGQDGQQRPQDLPGGHPLVAGLV
jgi:hypothetical protein